MTADSDAPPWEDFDAPHVGGGPWEDYKSEAAPDPNAPGVAESFLRGIPSGGTFGFENKIGFDKAKQEAAQKANPWSYFAGQVAGGFIPAVGASLLAPEVAVPAAVARVAPGLRTAYGIARSGLVPGEIASAGQAAVQGAKLGAVYGGLSGAGHADVHDTDTLPQALEKRAQGAVTGAAEGAATGPFVGLAGHGVYRGAQGLGSLYARAAADTAPGGIGALNTYVRATERDRYTPDDIIKQITSQFPDATQTTPGGPGAPLATRHWGDITDKQPITAQQVETAVRMAMDNESPSAISRALSPGGKGTGPGVVAVKSLLDELADRHLGPLNLVDRASLLRPGAGDNTQMTMRAMAATPGEHVGIAKEDLLNRQTGEHGLMQDLLTKMLGSSDLEAVAANESQKLKNAGLAAYSTAIANETPFDLNPILNKHLLEFQNVRGIGDQVRTAIADMQSPQPVLQQIPGNPSTVPGWGQTPLGPNWLPGAGPTEQLANPAGLLNRAPPMDLKSFIYARGGLSDKIGKATRDGENSLASKLIDLKDDLSAEVARTNPDWKTANDLYAEGKAAQNSLAAGQKMGLNLNARNREHLSEFTDAQDAQDTASDALGKVSKAILGPNTRRLPNDQELQAATPDQQLTYRKAMAQNDAAQSRQQLFKVGMLRPVLDKIMNKGETDDITREVLKPGARQIITKVMGKDADQFINSVRAMQARNRTYKSQFGSQTVPLGEAKEDLNWAPEFMASWAHPWQWPTKMLDLASRYAARTINAKRNKDLMETLTDTDPLHQLEFLRAAKNLHAIRSTAGNWFGTPVIMSSGPVSGTIPTHQPSNQPQPTLTPYRP